MAEIHRWNEKAPTFKSFGLGHEEARAKLVRATLEGGRIEAAGKRLAEVCLPHFELEEKFVYPVLGILRDLARGELQPHMAQVLPLIAEFSAMREALEDSHQSIRIAIEELLRASYQEQSWEFTEFARHLSVHEKIEDEVIYPMVILIGHYLRMRLRILQ